MKHIKKDLIMDKYKDILLIHFHSFIGFGVLWEKEIYILPNNESTFHTFEFSIKIPFINISFLFDWEKKK